MVVTPGTDLALFDWVVAAEAGLSLPIDTVVYHTER
jgi:hypothetical protein